MQTEQETKDRQGTMTGAAMVMRALEDHGVEHLFGYPGGAVLPLYEELPRHPSLRHILARHEQGAMHAAEGYARSSGKVGVVLVTSGPGATNTVTGLMDAMADSIPLVVITGQVATSLIGTDAFQECDTVAITQPCTKKNYQVRDIADLPRILHEAFTLAQSGRPGPVLIDIPKDIQNVAGRYFSAPQTGAEEICRPPSANNTAHASYHPDNIEKAVAMMRVAKRPVFYTGGGVINAGPQASAALRELVRMTGFPITSTLMGLGAYPASGPQWLGMLGMHGTLEANLAMHQADLIINIGARFDDRVTGKVDQFAPHVRKIHIDIDPREINKIVRVDHAIVADCGRVLGDMLAAWQAAPSQQSPALEDWWSQIDQWRAKDSLWFEASNEIIKPQYALRQLNARLAGQDAYVTSDVGQHQMWAAQHLGFERPNRWMTSGGLGTMGYGLPAAIGVQIAHPGATVVCVSGDASIQMNSQEMIVAADYELPIKVIILNNSWMGMVRQWQELIHRETYSQSQPRQPDFVKLAEANYWTGLRCKTPGEFDRALTSLLAAEGPCLLDCHVEPLENCFPMIAAGHAHNQINLGRRHPHYEPV